MSEGDGISNRPGPASAAEPSMEEILASIRRILSEEEGAAKLAPEDEGELVLNAGMRVNMHELPASATEPPEAEPALRPVLEEHAAPLHFAPDPTLESQIPEEPVQAFAPAPITFAPEAAAEPAPFMPAPVPHEPVFHDPVIQDPVIHQPVSQEPIADHQPVTYNEPVYNPAADEPPRPLAPEPAMAFEPLPPIQEPLAPEPLAPEPPAPIFSPIPEPEPASNEWAAKPPQAEQAYQPQPEQEEKEHIMEEQVQGPDGLVGEETVSEISNSIGALVRSVSAERSSSVGRPGVTIEDIVREEVKPVLKAWLDTHLPSLVERVVRAEINRVMDRAQG